MKSLFLFVTAIILLGLQTSAAELYVSPTGSDANPGTKARPMATLAAAQTKLRTMNKTEPVTVQVRAGVYELPATLALTAADSGTEKAPVVWQAYPGEKVFLIGGKPISGFVPYKGKILKADVGAQGFADINFRQLLCNGHRMDLARYPNRDANNPVTGGWAYVDGKPVPLYADVPGESMKLLQYREADARQWAHPEQAEVMIFPRYNWWNDIIRIASVDKATRSITLSANASYAIRPGDRYFVQNLLEELDAPGEWYLDAQTKTLYFWPPEGVNPATMSVSAPAVRTILKLQEGASNISFRGFTFECCEGNAIEMEKTVNCRIAACTIRNVGDFYGSGVVINGGERNGVVGCDIHDIGRDAVSIDGRDRVTLKPAGNYADNNYIHHTGIYFKQGVGVQLNGVGNRISHNLMHDLPRFGIGWSGNDHIIEYNEIRHCNLETADCGAIYCWQVDWTKRGTQIRYNYLHDIIGFGQENGKWTSPHMNWGIYLDDGTCGTHVYGNIVARTILGGVHVHGGRDNVIENNILVDGRDSQVQYSGYVQGGHPVPMMTETWKQFSGTSAYLKYPGYERLTKGLDDAWKMADNRFVRNIVSYSEPKAKLYEHYNLPFDRTVSDYNLIWHNKAPLLTGVTSLKGLTGPNLVPNPGFEAGDAGGLPEGWEWQIKPGDSSAQLDPTVKHSGKQSLRLDAHGTTTDSSGQTLNVNFVTKGITLIPGQTYRLSARVRADVPTPGTIMPQAYLANKYFWAKYNSFTAGPEWKQIETVFRFPAKGDPDWHADMSTVRIRIDISQATGSLWVDDVEQRKADTMSEWEAWQAKGLDKHSVIADPLFVNRAADDYRLKPNSPAFKLGFQPIPVEKIGPYKSELRASWPIKQAIGAREQMKIDWSRH